MIAIHVGLSIFGHSHASFHEVALKYLGGASTVLAPCQTPTTTTTAPTRSSSRFQPTMSLLSGHTTLTRRRRSPRAPARDDDNIDAARHCAAREELSPASIDLHVARRFVLEQLSVHVRHVDFSVDDARLFLGLARAVD
ncbi:hypothetical protein SPRG_16225 [Saprolegnia parasitica CBS 223.65]|uniref:Uncharacterized protein n=1 Tax=Saprolegnia parasitica (strain CBS 223.65) TaxID=695850 RepID=A0A067BUW1_SAPPC|nr:hypothetical protein SPRG_16225 [Saprolegnia parasitica CBS 223.65]KDO18412.1 hypothetical protein SPRG_16225 [Saprolegnia parasitica CBS 223.65]|eukprot:XP_012210877.1 hypothetical protein SPRG_16225 [Saprolegnia parasitica CBS 223.65]